jgi:hypothetical protein
VAFIAPTEGKGEILSADSFHHILTHFVSEIAQASKLLYFWSILSKVRPFLKSTSYSKVWGNVPDVFILLKARSFNATHF